MLGRPPSDVVGKSGECRRKQLVSMDPQALQAHRAAESARVKAARASRSTGFQRDEPEDIGSDDDVQSSDSSEPEPVQVHQKTFYLQFGEDLEEDADCVPQEYAEFSRKAAQLLGVTNLRLWLSYIAIRAAVHSYAARGTCPGAWPSGFDGALQHLRKFPRQACPFEGLKQKALPFLDTFRRDRSSTMHKVFVKLWHDMVLTEARLALFGLLDFMFRYTGFSFLCTDVLYSRIGTWSRH